jgi:dephospho-CoA kinase
MLTIGITGGMGSGKTTVCKCFEVLGAPVFYADGEAKKLYSSSARLKDFMLENFGEESYKNGIPDRAFIAQQIFGNPELLQKLESVIHPLVGQRWNEWLKEQDFPYVIREAAILIESKSYLTCDEVVIVEAPLPLRIQWIRKRSGLSEKEINDRISRQWTDDQKRPFAQHVIQNDNSQLMMPLILQLHQSWLAQNDKS